MKNYKSFNWIMLGLSIYVIIYPLISIILTAISPEITTCAYKAATGEPCPMCGGTRYFSSVLSGSLKLENLMSPFLVMFFVILVELIGRIYILINFQKIKNNLIKYDIIYHIIIVVLYYTYIVTYMIN